jgi:adenylate cyclase
VLPFTLREKYVTIAKAERRLAAIVAADVVGYSRLMGIDEEGTLEALKTLRADVIDPLVAQHGGHLVKTTGDGLLLEFPSVLQAVACSVAFQRKLAERIAGATDGLRIQFRIGINLGDVIIDEGDVFGDGVNIAARLEQLATPGGICISDDVYRHVAGKLDVQMTDAGRKRLKNIAQPIKVYRIAPGSHDSRPTKKLFPISRAGQWFPAAISAVGTLALVMAGLVWVLIGHMPGGEKKVQPAQGAANSLPIVAVLPFANQTGDEAQNYFADGFTEELIGALGRFNTMRVIGRNAVAPYKRQTARAVEIASKLGAAYLVEGGVRSSKDHLRVSARLVDGHSATVLWSDQFDGSASDIFRFQDAISRSIAGTLAASIAQMEGQKSLMRPTPSSSAHDLVLQARAIGYGGSRQANRRYRELVKKAIEIDPNYATAYAFLAEALYARVALGWTEFATRDAERGETYARKAITLAPNEPDGHRALGRIYLLRAEYDQAIEELHRAVEINPSDSNALAGWGSAKMFTGDMAGAIKPLELAVKYNPALEPIYFGDLAHAYYFAGHNEDAVRIAERGISQYQDYPRFHLIAAAAAARLGQMERAKRHVREVQKRLPLFSVDAVTSRFRDSKYLTYLKEGLKMAGL